MEHTMTVTVRRNAHREIEATTRIDMPEIGPRKFMLITTSKRYDKRLTTVASVNTAHEDGLGYVHAFGFGSSGDFRETLAANTVRCTEKAVEAQHTDALTLLEWGDLKERAIAFYASKPGATGFCEHSVPAGVAA